MKISEIFWPAEKTYTLKELNEEMGKAVAALESNGISITKGGTIKYEKAVEIFGKAIINRGLHENLIVVNKDYPLSYGGNDAILTTNPFVRENISGELFEIAVPEYSHSLTPKELIKKDERIVAGNKLERFENNFITKRAVVAQQAAAGARVFLMNEYVIARPEYKEIIVDADENNCLTIFPDLIYTVINDVRELKKNYKTLEKYSKNELGKFLELNYNKFPDKFYSGKPGAIKSIRGFCSPFTKKDLDEFDISAFKPEDLSFYFENK